MRRQHPTARQRAVFPVGGQFLQAPPVAMAHRGGANYAANAGIENSLQAVRNAVDLGYRYVEIDVRASADGVAFVLHDPDLARVAGTDRPIHAMTAHEVRAATLSGGEPIPTLGELLEEFGRTRFNIDVKSDDVLAPALADLDAADAYTRVLIGSFDHRRLQRARAARPQLATSASPRESIGVRWGQGRLRTLAARNGVLCLQVPLTYRGRKVLTPGAVRRAHAQHLQVHVWTIDDAATINELLDLGVDGIITDRIDVLKEVLIRRGGWSGSDVGEQPGQGPRNAVQIEGTDE